MRVEIRIKPDELELSSVQFIELGLSLGERTITEQGQAFWVFENLPRAVGALKAVEQVEKIRLAHAKK